MSVHQNKKTGRGLIATAIILLWLLTPSCAGRMESIEEYNRWLNESGHGCIQTRTIAGIRLAIKYLPPGYSVLRDLERVDAPTNELVDSLFAVHGTTCTFLMNIGPDKNSGEDETRPSVMDEGIADHSQYTERMLSTNFGMAEHITLYADSVSFKPVYCIVENLYELSDDRNFLVLFADSNRKLMDARDYVFVYDDPFFNIGTVQLAFEGNKLRQAKSIGIK